MRFQYSKIIVYFLLLILPVCLLAKNWHGQLLYGLRVATEAEKSRFVFDFKKDGPIKYRAFLLKDPDRIVIDLPATRLTADLENPALINTPVKSVRSGFTNRNDLRLVLDLKESVQFKCSILKGAHGTKEKRLVLDLFKKLESVTTSNLEKNNVDSESTIEKENPSAAKLQPKVLPRANGKLRDITIVIDPGHGGADSGAVGENGIKEKDVVLAISKYLKYYLNQEAGIRALLTRSGDYFIALRNRLDIAHYDHADLFIAIHADACDKSDRRGASVYALSQRGATSDLARELAEKENASELGHAGVDKSLVLKNLLIDLAQTWTINNSLLMGNIILQELSEVTGLHIFHVEQAAFVVLKSPNIPSLLVETGFISNPSEEKRLNDDSYQQKIAYALAQGIKEYFIQHPARGTYFSMKNAK